MTPRTIIVSSAIGIPDKASTWKGFDSKKFEIEYSVKIKLELELELEKRIFRNWAEIFWNWNLVEFELELRLKLIEFEIEPRFLRLRSVVLAN